MDSPDNIPGTVLITGAANGLGRALTQIYLAHGWKVIATDLDEQGLNDYNENKSCQTFKMDVTSDQDVDRVYKIIREEDSRVDLLINNAGIDRYFPFSEAPVEMFEEIIRVNVFGAYRVNQVFLPVIKRPGGKIIQIGSESAHLTVPFMPYPLSKNLLERYTKVLRQELGFIGIDVLCVIPGAFNSRILRDVSYIRYPVSDPLLDGIFKRFASKAAGEITRILDPKEVASFIYSISGKRKPKAVYRINNNLQLRLIGWLPYRLMEKIILRKLRD